jgi:hypothetical protein
MMIMYSINKILKIMILSMTLWASSGFSATISTNEATFTNPQPWLTESRINRVIENIQNYMEWDVRKVNVIWHNSQEEFQNFHHFDSTVLAVSVLPKNEVHLGPRITTANFDPVFGHEMVHIVLYQKYKEAIPKWINEGLANFIAKQGKVNYPWIATKPFMPDVRALVHPFQQPDGGVLPAKVESQYHYQASTALAEMIDSKCGLKDMLQLSVGKNLETYLTTTCEISDINAAFKEWVLSKVKK